MPPRPVVFQVDGALDRGVMYWCASGAGGLTDGSGLEAVDSAWGDSGSTELCDFSSQMSSRLPMTIFRTFPFAGSTSMTSLGPKLVHDLARRRRLHVYSSRI